LTGILLLLASIEFQYNKLYGNFCILRFNTSFRSSRIYAIDTIKDPRAPALHKVVQPEDIIQKTGLAYPHTAHCLASGDIMVSCLGNKEGKAEGNGFLLLDSEFNVKGRYCIFFFLETMTRKIREWDSSSFFLFKGLALIFIIANLCT
jgi:hypothetical protein